MLLLITGLVAFLLVSGASDTRWGRGVRAGVSGAARGVREAAGPGVRGRVSGGLSGARTGAVSGWSTPPLDTRRPAGRTGRQTLLQRVSGRAVRGVRTIMGRASGQALDFRTPMPRPMLLNRPDGTAKEFQWDEEGGEALPRLRPGERIFWLNEYGSVDNGIGSPITYEDQQPGGIDHIENADDFSPSRFEPQHRCGYCRDTKRWPSQEETCPWCTGTLSLVYTYRDAIGAARVSHIGWSPGDPIPDAIRPFSVMDPKTGGSTGEVTADDLQAMTDEAAALYGPQRTRGEEAARRQAMSELASTLATNSAHRGGDPAGSLLAADVYRAQANQLRQGDQNAPFNQATEGLPTAGDLTPAPRQGDRMTSTDAAEAIESLPQYRRYLTTAKTRALAEREDLEAAVTRLTQWSIAVREATERFAAMHGDPATYREGHEVAEHAHMAKECALRATGVLDELTERIQIALDGLRRHDQVQEAHDSNVHLDRAAYDGN